MATGVTVVGVAAAGAVAAAALTLLRWALRCSMVARQTARKGKLEFAAWREEPTNATNAAGPS